MNGVHEEQKVQPTLGKLKGNLILNHRKPPDGTIVSKNVLYDDCMNDFNERTPNDSMSGTLTEERSVFGRTTRNDNWRDEVNNKSNEPEIAPANREPPNLFCEQIARCSSEALISYHPGKRSSKRELDQERCGLRKEFDEIYRNPQATLQQLNKIHAKWLLHQYKRVHRLLELGGGNTNSPHHTCLKRQFELIADDRENWLNTLAAYSIIHNVAVTISREDIEDANVLDSLPPGTAKFDEQLKWVEEKAPAALHVHLRRRASRQA